MDRNRRPLMAGNWKMYKTRLETVTFLEAFAPLVEDVVEREILVCPPAVTIETALAFCEDSNVQVGAQTMHFADDGAFTGEPFEEAREQFSVLLGWKVLLVFVGLHVVPHGIGELVLRRWVPALGSPGLAAANELQFSSGIFPELKETTARGFS